VKSHGLRVGEHRFEDRKGGKSYRGELCSRKRCEIENHMKELGSCEPQLGSVLCMAVSSSLFPSVYGDGLFQARLIR